MFAQNPTPATTGTAVGGEKKENIQGAVQSPDFLLYSVLLAVLLLLSAAVFYLVDRWRKVRPDAEGDREASLTLSSFREMYEDGEITEAEYHKLRDKMATKLRGGVRVSSPAPPGAKKPADPAPAQPLPPPDPPSAGKPPDPAS